MKHLVMLMLAVLLTGCMSAKDTQKDTQDWIAPLTFDSSVNIGPEQAVVIVGLSVVHPRTKHGILNLDYTFNAGWIAYNRATMRRVGKLMLSMTEPCAAIGNRVCDGGVDYFAYKISAGDYALSWVGQDKLASMASFGEITQTTVTRANIKAVSWDFSEAALVLPTAPVFRVSPGEVVYVGDLTFDLISDGGITFSWKQDEAAARAWLTANEDSRTIAEKMVTRPLKLAGSPGIIGSRFIPYLVFRNMH